MKSLCPATSMHESIALIEDLKQRQDAELRVDPIVRKLWPLPARTLAIAPLRPVEPPRPPAEDDGDHLVNAPSRAHR